MTVVGEETDPPVTGFAIPHVGFVVVDGFVTVVGEVELPEVEPEEDEPVLPVEVVVPGLGVVPLLVDVFDVPVDPDDEALPV